MRVLMISGDKRILEPGTTAHERYKLQASQVEVLDVIVWPHASFLKPFFVQERYDAVTAQDPFWRGLVAWFVARRVGARLNIQVHTDLTTQSWVKHVLAQIVLRHADSVRVVSERIQQQIKNMGVRASSSILPVFIDVEAFRNLKPRVHAQKTILWIGRFEKEKDPLRAISILEDVRNANIDAKLVMVGDGSLQPQLQQCATKRSLELPITIVPWQKDITPQLEVADVVVCTSHTESWGASIVEALASGVPVVAPDVGVAREAGAIVVDRESLSQAVVEVLKAGTRGALQIAMPTAQEWAVRWKDSL